MEVTIFIIYFPGNTTLSTNERPLTLRWWECSVVHHCTTLCCLLIKLQLHFCYACVSLPVYTCVNYLSFPIQLANRKQPKAGNYFGLQFESTVQNGKHSIEQLGGSKVRSMWMCWKTFGEMREQGWVFKWCQAALECSTFSIWVPTSKLPPTSHDSNIIRHSITWACIIFIAKNKYKWRKNKMLKRCLH